jgi:FAD synthetase
MNTESLASKYVASAEQVLEGLEIERKTIEISNKNTSEVLESAKAYLADAKYYRDRNEFEVSLASVAYCEGLLDALRMLGTVKFEWPTRRRKE